MINFFVALHPSSVNGQTVRLILQDLRASNLIHLEVHQPGIDDYF